MGRGKRGASSELVAKGVLVRVLGRSRRVSSDVETMWVTTTFRSLPPIVPSRREWRDVRVKPRTLRSAHTTGITRAAEYDMVAKARASVGRVSCKTEWCGSDAAQRTKSLLAPKYQVVIRFPRRFPRSVKAIVSHFCVRAFSHEAYVGQSELVLFLPTEAGNDLHFSLGVLRHPATEKDVRG